MATSSKKPGPKDLKKRTPFQGDLYKKYFKKAT
jgi:hypothetical protein